MPRSRLRAIGAEQTIPPRQIETKVAVGLGRHNRVMHPVHVRRHHRPAQHRIERQRQPHIAVVEHRRRIQHHLKQQHRHQRRPQRRNHRKLDPHRQQHLDRMKAQPGSDIKLQISMMHAVQPPQHRHRVEQHMLRINRQIQQHKRERNGGPHRRMQPIEQAPALRLHIKRKTHRAQRQHQLEHHRIEGSDAQIGRPAPAAPHPLRPARRSQFPCGHQHQHQGEHRQPDEGLVPPLHAGHGISFYSA